MAPSAKRYTVWVAKTVTDVWVAIVVGAAIPAGSPISRYVVPLTLAMATISFGAPFQNLVPPGVGREGRWVKAGQYNKLVPTHLLRGQLLPAFRVSTDDQMLMSGDWVISGTEGGRNPGIGPDATAKRIAHEIIIGK